MPETYHKKKRRGIAGLTGRTSVSVPLEEYWPGLGELVETPCFANKKERSNKTSKAFRKKDDCPTKLDNNSATKQPEQQQQQQQQLENCQNVNTTMEKIGSSTNQRNRDLERKRLQSRRRFNPRSRRRSPSRTEQHMIVMSQNDKCTFTTIANCDGMNQALGNKSTEKEQQQQSPIEQPQQGKNAATQRSSHQARVPSKQVEKRVQEPVLSLLETEQSPIRPSKLLQSPKRKRPKRMLNSSFPYIMDGAEQGMDSQIPQQSTTNSPSSRTSSKTKRRKRMLSELLPYNKVGLRTEEVEPGQARNKAIREKKEKTLQVNFQHPPKTKRMKRMLADLLPYNAFGLKEVGMVKFRRKQATDPPKNSRAKQMAVRLVSRTTPSKRKAAQKMLDVTQSANECKHPKPSTQNKKKRNNESEKPLSLDAKHKDGATQFIECDDECVWV